MELDVFTGGIFDTNCFFLHDSAILVDAPQGSADWLAENGYRVAALLLTHGHVDHIWDAARIAAEHRCRVICHPDTVPIVTDRNFFKQYGLNWEIEPFTPDWIVDETPSLEIAGIEFRILHLPGHCPGSIGFLMKSENLLFSGDVLFSGGIGNTSLPRANHAELIASIQGKLWALDDDVTVIPGHGPATKIGIEKRTNPYAKVMN